MKKKIAIAGMGVAGSFLLRLLLQRGTLLTVLTVLRLNKKPHVE